MKFPKIRLVLFAAATVVAVHASTAAAVLKVYLSDSPLSSTGALQGNYVDVTSKANTSTSLASYTSVTGTTTGTFLFSTNDTLNGSSGGLMSSGGTTAPNNGSSSTQRAQIQVTGGSPRKNLYLIYQDVVTVTNPAVIGASVNGTFQRVTTSGTTTTTGLASTYSTYLNSTAIVAPGSTTSATAVTGSGTSYFTGSYTLSQQVGWNFAGTTGTQTGRSTFVDNVTLLTPAPEGIMLLASAMPVFGVPLIRRRLFRKSV